MAFVQLLMMTAFGDSFDIADDKFVRQTEKMPLDELVKNGWNALLLQLRLV